MNTTALVKSLASRGDRGTGLELWRLSLPLIGEAAAGLASRERKSRASTWDDLMVFVMREARQVNEDQVYTMAWPWIYLYGEMIIWKLCLL